MVSGKKKDLALVEGGDGENVFANGKRRCLGLGVGDKLVRLRLVDDGGVGQVGDGGHFGFLC